MFSKVRTVGLLLLSTCAAASAQQWTEQVVLDLFDQQTPLRRETQASAAAAVETMRGRTLWPNPIASYSREGVGYTEFFEVQQQIPISGRLGLAQKTIEPARQAAEADGAARTWNIRSNVRAAFYRALAAQQTEDLIRASLDDMQEVLRVLRTREAEGVGIPYDRLRIERETADLRADIAVAGAQARSELMILQSYLPPQTTVGRLTGALAPQLVSSSSEAMVQQSLMSRAEFRAQTSRIAQLDLEQKAAERLKVPDLIFSGGLKRTETYANPDGTGLKTANGTVISLNVAIPSFNKGQTEVARLSFERDQVRAQRDQLTQQVSALVSGAYDLYSVRTAALATFDQETAGTGQELLRIARVAYEEGEGGILQLLDAYRLNRQTALRRQELQLAVRETEIELSRAAGFEVAQ